MEDAYWGAVEAIESSSALANLLGTLIEDESQSGWWGSRVACINSSDQAKQVATHHNRPNVPKADVHCRDYGGGRRWAYR